MSDKINAPDIKELVYLASRAGLNQLELAQRAGITAASLSQWKNAKNDPLLFNYFKLVRAYNDYLTEQGGGNGKYSG